MEGTGMEIDDSLYSRQRYMLGDQAMKKMMSSSILILGCGSLGVEIAKNLALTGVGNLEIADSKTIGDDDVKTNFYVNNNETQNGHTRASACVPRLKELNPYVSVTISSLDKVIGRAVEGDSDSLSSLKESLENFNCIVVTESSLRQQQLLNKLCRQSKRSVKYISANVYGVFSSIFCDFGKNFEVFDPNGEPLKESFVARITNAAEGVVTCLENTIHGLETGDLVTFKGLDGMEELNDQVRPVKVVSPYAFSIGNTEAFSQYRSGGMFKQIRQTKTISHGSFQDELLNPTILPADFGKFENPLITHVAFIALNKFITEKGCLPRSWNADDASELYAQYADTIKSYNLDAPDNEVAKKLVEVVSFTCRGFLPPLCAAIAGIVAQEALKSLTGKYTPLNQWLYVDALELIDNLPQKPADVSTSCSALDMCLGKNFTDYLSSLNIFMVGCGAIGCEMLKNLALLGVSSRAHGGKMVITDHDTIEKSNLNRQFLFRSKHVGQSKSIVGGSVAKEINPDLHIEPLQHKVGPDTESTVFTDEFFKSNDIIVNALDNVQARRYMDARCVNNQLPLVESGTMGPKGHVQVVVPFVTESYSSQSDPPEIQYPFCTLKSFPSQIGHTIQWARDKFEALFSQKPMLYNKFWDGYRSTMGKDVFDDISNFNQYLEAGASISDAYIVVKLLSNVPKDWSDCVQYARCKFEVFFNHKAKNLLNAFPLDTRLEDDSLFWSLPKRPPTPIVFDPADTLHMQFITSLAFLMASMNDIEAPSDDAEIHESVSLALQKTQIPKFVASKKDIVTDETAQPTKTEVMEDVDSNVLQNKLSAIIASKGKIPRSMNPEHFEKDDDSNHHIDFIYSAASLRAKMYAIETVDRLEVKRIAGRIIPAISTTTSAVAGFVTIQFLQLAIQMMKNRESNQRNWVQVPQNEVANELTKYRNAFLNLALPIVIFSEPAGAQRTAIGSDFSFTDWDQWEVRGNKDFKLKDLMDHFQSKLQLTVSSVLQGSRMVYMFFMPGHSKKIGQLMTKLIKVQASVPYIDLTISFTNPDGGDDLSCPVVRYYY